MTNRNKVTIQPPSFERDYRALTELRDANLANNLCLPLKRREGSMNSKEYSNRKANNKENIKEIDDGVLKLIGGAGINRVCQEKAQVIQHQKAQIAALKQCMNKIWNKGNKENEQIEENRSRMQQMARLRELEKEYMQNLKEFDGMKENMRDIRKQYDSAVNEKNAMTQKYKNVLNQNEEMTVLIDTLKQEIQTTTTRSMRDVAVQAELTQLKEELKSMQEQKEAVEERLSTFEQRANDYITRYNDSQNAYNQLQISHFRMQKETDSLRADSEDMQLAINHLNNQLAVERDMHIEEVERLRMKARKEEEARGDMYRSWHQEERRQQQIEKRLQELRKQSEMEKDHFRQMMAQKEENITELREALVRREAELERKIRSQAERVNNLNRLEGQIEQRNEYITQQNQTLRSENRSLTAILTLHQQQIKELESRKAQLQTIHIEQTKIIEELQERVTALDEQIIQLKSDVGQATERGSERQYYIEKYENELHRNNEFTVQLSQLQLENSSLLKRNATNSIEIGSLKAELVLLRSQIDSVIQQDCENTVRERHLEEQLKFAQEQNEISNGEVAELRECLAKVRKEVKDMFEEGRVVAGQMRELEEENGALRRQLWDAKNIADYQQGSIRQQLTRVQNHLKQSSLQTARLCKTIKEKDRVIAAIRFEVQQQVSDLRTLRSDLAQSEYRHKILSQQYQTELASFQQLKNQWKVQAQQGEYKRRELEYSQVSASQELGSSYNTVEILKRENEELQRIFTTQIERRNSTIRELVAEKKALFQQLMDRSL